MLLLRSFKRLRSSPENSYCAFPLLVTAIFSTAVLAAWQISTQQGARDFRDTISSITLKAQDRFRERSGQVSNAIARYGSRIELLGTTNEKYLETDSKNYLEQINIIRRIGITNAKFDVIWSYPKEIRSQVDGFNEIQDSKRKEAFESARLTHQPSLSRTVVLRSGNLGNILPVALFRDDEFVGEVYGSIQADKLFSDWFNPSEFQATVQESGNTVFDSTDGQKTLPDYSRKLRLKWGLADWELTVTPTEEYAKRCRSNAPILVLLVGELIALLFGFLLLSMFRVQQQQILFSDKEKTILTRMNIALEAAQIGAWSIDLKTGEVWRSQDHDRIFGYETPLEKWDQDVFFSHILPEDRERTAALQKENLHSNSSHQIDIRIRRADDESIRWIRVQAQSLFDSENQPIRMIGIIRDLTEDKIRESERELDLEWRKTILNSAEYSIISTDASGIILTFNPAAEKILGYTASEVIGKEKPSLFRDKLELQARADALSAVEGKPINPDFDVFVHKMKTAHKPEKYETVYINKNGNRIPIDLSITPLLTASGEIRGYLGIAFDLTERKRAEQKLLIAHQRLERLIESTGEGIWERDWNAKTIQFIDRQGKHIYGYAEDEYPLYDDIVARINPLDRDQIKAKLEKHVLEDTNRFDIEFRIADRFNPNQEKWLRSTGRVTRKNGAPHQVIATIGEVTAQVINRKALEQALVTADTATKAKSAFLASMSHEIRTPLNGVIGMTDLLLDTDLKPEQKAYTLVVQQSGTALLGLINDILDFSKIEAGKMELENSNLNLAEIVEGQIDILSVKAKEKGISLVSFISPEIPSSLVGDPGRIGQILLNLIGNAIKFTSAGGVSVRVLGKSTGIKGAPESIRFEICDTGIGMSERTLSKLFQPFAQADATISGRFGGTGLGLSISKKLTELMLGTIGVESTPGKGSVFWFEIPLVPGLHTEKEESRKLSWEKISGLRTLLIEEDEISRRSIQEYMESFGMKCDCVSSVSEAFSSIDQASEAKDSYQLILVAPARGDSENLQIRKELNQNLRTSNPKMIYVSHLGEKKDEETLFDQGFSSLLRKPVKQSTLLNAITAAISNSDSKPKDRVTIIPSAVKETSSGHSKLRILVAEDSSVNQLLTRKMLDYLGYASTTVANGLEVLVAVRQSEFDLILMDCQMPEMDGFEATRKVREFPNSKVRSIPIVALTANAMDGDSKKCLDAGMDDYLTKPMKKDQLKATLDKWLGEASLKKSA
jgi:PAS domain S-box-containing protein